MLALLRLFNIAQCWKHSDWQHLRNENRCLAGVSNNGRGIKARLPGPTMSASTRRRIAAAQKARWAKRRDGTTETSGVTIAQLLTEFWGRSANRSIGNTTPSGADIFVILTCRKEFLFEMVVPEDMCFRGGLKKLLEPMDPNRRWGISRQLPEKKWCALRDSNSRPSGS
jgi:hypothetical protein